MLRPMSETWNSNSAPDSYDIPLCLLWHRHITYFLLLRVKTIPTNQHESVTYSSRSKIKDYLHISIQVRYLLLAFKGAGYPHRPTRVRYFLLASKSEGYPHKPIRVCYLLIAFKSENYPHKPTLVLSACSCLHAS